MSREMKDSGVEWIGEIPETWASSRIGKRYKFGKGLSITKENLKDKGVAVISYGQIHSKINTGTYLKDLLFRYVDDEYMKSYPQCLVHVGDFIFADTSEDYEGCGNCVYVDRDMTLFAGYHTIILTPYKHEYGRYFAYLFKSNAWKDQIRMRVYGVKVFSITRKILSETVCLIPPIIEQKIIANYLDAKCAEIDKVVEKTRESIEEYKKLKQEVITEAVTKGVRGPRPMKPSGVEWIGDISKTWEIIRIKYVTRQRNQKSTYNPSRDIYIGLENIIGLSNTLIETESQYEETEYCICKKDDVLYSRLRPNLAKTIICPFDAFCTGELMVFSKFRGEKRFFRYWLLGLGFRDNVVRSTYGAKMPRANPTYIVNLPMCFPPTGEQQEIADYLDAKCGEIDRLISKKEQLITELETYKKSLIYEYVTGKKEVPA